MNTNKVLQQKRQQGFSIIEVMIVSLLGIIITGVVFRILISTNNTMGVTEAQNQAMDSGRFAINYISGYARQAGYFENSQNQLPLYFDQTTPDIFNQNQNNGTGDVFVTVIDPDVGKEIACNNVSAGIASGDIILNIFFVEGDSLWCRGYNLTTPTAAGSPLVTKQEIVKGIEALHVLYGVSADTASNNMRATTKFVSADALSETEKENISAVRIALLSASTDESSKLSQETQSYILLDSAVYGRQDLKSRQIFTTTIALNYFPNSEGL